MSPHDTDDDAITAMIHTGRAPLARYNNSLKPPRSGHPKYGWAVPSAEAIQAIDQFVREGRGLLELGAGTGVWSAIVARALLARRVIATDSGLTKWDFRWHRVEELDALAAMTKYPDTDVLTVYPLRFIADVIRRMAPGQRLFWRGPVESKHPQLFPDNYSNEITEVGRADCELASGDFDGKLIVFEKDRK